MNDAITVNNHYLSLIQFFAAVAAAVGQISCCLCADRGRVLTLARRAAASKSSWPRAVAPPGCKLSDHHNM